MSYSMIIINIQIFIIIIIIIILDIKVDTRISHGLYIKIWNLKEDLYNYFASSVAK